jgi:hypothetical protein
LVELPLQGLGEMCFVFGYKSHHLIISSPTPSLDRQPHHYIAELT